MLIAIDTATRLMSLALHDGQTLIAEQSWITPNQHTTDLAPAIRRMMAITGVEVAALTAVAASIGPGSYTGLRAGVSLAKGLAAARNLPLVGVTSLDTIAAAQPYYQGNGGLIAVVQAGRGRVIVRTYRWRKGRWSSHAEPQLMNWPTLLQSIDGPAYLTGEIDQAGLDAVKDAQDNGVTITLVPAANRLRRAGFLAELAWESLHAAEDQSLFEPSRLAPLYVKTEDSPGSEPTA